VVYRTLTNLLDENVTVDTSSIVAGSTHVEILSADPMMKIGDPSQVSRTSCDLGQKAVQLPPLALAWLTPQ
jgi:hypothetical protein